MHLDRKQFKKLKPEEKTQAWEARKEAMQIENVKLAEGMDDQEKFAFFAMRTFRIQKENLVKFNFCESCWLVNNACMCSKLADLNVKLDFPGNYNIMYNILYYSPKKITRLS